MANIKFSNRLDSVSLTPPSRHKYGLDKVIMSVFPSAIQQILEAIPQERVERLQEIRCRLNHPIILLFSNDEQILQKNGQVMNLSYDDFNFILQRVNQCSVYALEEEYRRGYITLPGGHRVGIVGKALLTHGEVRTMKDISSLNFRIAKEIIGAANGVIPYIIENDRVCNTLIVSPPGCGKTTMLRDMVRQLSNGIPALHFNGVTVGVVDERSELAGSILGEPQLDLGMRTDVLDGCPKSQGMVMLIRSMSPKVLVTDEIGTAQDVMALEDALNAGIAIITTIHGQGWPDLEKRPHFNQLIKQQFFERIIFLSRQQGMGTIEQIYTNGERQYVPL